MRRWLMIASAAVSATACAAVVALAIRSYRVKDKWEYVSPGGWSTLTISRAGRVDFLYSYTAPHGDVGWTHIRGSPDSLGGTDYGTRFLGLGTGLTPGLSRYVNVPYWALIVITALPVLALARREWNRRRVRAGRCTACGYDLRASPDRCPECGTPVPGGR